MSPRPVKHAPPCPSLLRAREGEPGSAPIQLCGSVDLVPSFPSPQEFEFAKELHNSIPASPISPARYKQDEGSVIDAYVSDNATVSTDPSSARTTSTEMTTVTVPPTCSTITRHPLHTFVLPRLCRPCHRVREQNMARFEAEVIKEIVERALGGVRASGATGGQSGVVDAAKTRIQRRSAERGKMIPLKLLQQQPGPVQREDQEMPRAGVSNGIGLMGGVSVAYVAPTTPRAQYEQTAKPGSPSHSQGVSIASTKTNSSWWPWDRPSTPTASSIPAAAPLSPPATPKRKSSVEKWQHKKRSSVSSIPSPRARPSRLSWRSFNHLDVKRDILGRNAKGMNRIMGWGSEENAGSRNDVQGNMS